MNKIKSILALTLFFFLIRLQGQSVAPEQSQPCKTVLIDAAHDGGAWWFPQAQAFDREAPHQGLDFETC
jgi:hypothetical protein